MLSKLLDKIPFLANCTYFRRQGNSLKGPKQFYNLEDIKKAVKEAVKEALQNKQGRTDTSGELSAFLKECCILEPKPARPSGYRTRTQAQDLADAWEIWLVENRPGLNVVPSAKQLSGMLKGRGILSIKSNCIVWLGIQLKPEWRARLPKRKKRNQAKAA